MRLAPLARIARQGAERSEAGEGSCGTKRFGSLH